ncbi:MAG: metal-dependent hydrolase [Chitinophagales bacterium]
MDTLTHFALGACIGELFLGRQIGKKAMLIGAIANSIPDVDFIAALWMSPVSNLLAHRGFTHSFLFGIIIAIILAHLFERQQKGPGASLIQWVLFFLVQIFSHLFLDAFNAYGIGWFEPFSHYRISWNTIFVVDPFFSIWLGAASLALLILKRNDTNRFRWARSGILFSSLYLLYCLVNRSVMESRVKIVFAKEQIAYGRYFISPTPLNSWLWYIVAENDSGYQIGYSSLFDKNIQFGFQYFPRNDALIQELESHEEFQHLRRFSKGYYVIEKRKDTLVFNDLRFGQIGGWVNPRARFTFQYFLQDPGGNKLVLQRGRFQLWNREAIKSLLRRIKGIRVSEGSLQ